MKFNASNLKLWMDCQQKAFFSETVDRPRSLHAKTVFGTCIHDALEYYNNTNDLELSKKRFEYYWTNPIKLGSEPTKWNGVQFGSLMQRGLEILDQYDEKQKWQEREVIATEHKFCVPIGEHYVSGIVDLLEFKLSGRGIPTLKIVDYKSTSKQPSLKELRLDLQFTIYFYASLQKEFWFGFEPEIEKYKPLPNADVLYERFIDVERRCSWYHLWGNKELDAGDRDDDDFLRLYRLLNAIEKAKEAEIYIPSIRAESCNFCDYVDLCSAVEPIKDKLELEIGLDGDDGMF